MQGYSEVVSNAPITPPKAADELEKLALEVRHGLISAVHNIVSAVPGAAIKAIAELGRYFADDGLRAALQSELNAFVAKVDEELDRYERDGRAFLYDEMLANHAIVLIALARTGHEEVIADGLECALTDEALVTEIDEAVANAARLSEAQRRRFELGLELLVARDWIPACDLILKGVEGALWNAAESTGVIDEARYFVEPPMRYVKGPEALVEGGRLSGLSPSFRRFVSSLVFDAEGHDLRHGRGGIDPRLKALYSAAALLGWLDAFAETTLVGKLADRLGAFADSIEIERLAREPIFPDEVRAA